MAAPPRMRVVDLHRPDALNALNSEMVATLLPLFQDWQQVGGDVKLVVMRGAGDRAFCAGGDICFLHECASGYAATGDPAALSPAHEFFRAEYTLNNVLGTSRVPVVSILGGIVMGGGVGLSVHGQVRIATDSTSCAAAARKNCGNKSPRASTHVSTALPPARPAVPLHPLHARQSSQCPRPASASSPTSAAATSCRGFPPTWASS